MICLSEKNAAGIAQPDSVCRPVMKSNVGGQRIRALQDSVGLSGQPRHCSRSIRRARACAMFRMISAYTHGIGSNFPGQSPDSEAMRATSRHAAPTLRACDSPARREVAPEVLPEDGDEPLATSLNLVYQPAGNGRVAVDSAVAQKRPIAADVFQMLSGPLRR